MSVDKDKPGASEDVRHLTADELQQIEETYDPELRFRVLVWPLTVFTATVLFLLSCYHFYTAGFGIPQATVHRGLHLGVTLLVVFLASPPSARRRSGPARWPPSACR